MCAKSKGAAVVFAGLEPRAVECIRAAPCCYRLSVFRVAGLVRAKKSATATWPAAASPLDPATPRDPATP
eukprot:scaffold14251_cov78-Phaeocystis_antarctica.AAC.1